MLTKIRFQDIWKKWNIFPIHKKGHKLVINNYRPVSLNSLFEYLKERNLLSAHQTGCSANDDCKSIDVHSS